jgi:hypothetical protein
MLEIGYRLLDALGIAAQFLPEFGQPVAGRVSNHELLTELPFERLKPAMNGRPAEAQSLRRRERTAAAGHRDEISEFVPVKHA